MKKSARNKARIIALGAAIVIFGIIGYIVYPHQSNQPEYIFDKSYHISLDDVKAARTPLSIPGYDTDNSQSGDKAKSEPAAEPDINLQKLFAEGLINNRTTLKYFKYLEYLFRETPDLADHFKKVRAYLFAHFSPSDAQTLFDTYKKYLKCKMDMVGQFSDLSTVKSPEDAIALLEQIQAFRRAQLGAQLADTLFGADVKAKEYALRRAEIVMNNSLNGDEKERMIKQLDEDMWGKDANAVEKQQPAYNQYQEKLQIYQKDLNGMNAADRQAKIQQFRKEYFPPKIVKKLNDIDAQMAQEKATEKEYTQEAKAINDNPDLTEKQKKQQITDLQNKTFGKQADEFRRRQAISEGRAKLIEEHEKEQNSAGTNGE